MVYQLRNLDREHIWSRQVCHARCSRHGRDELRQYR